jgi:hypothetical protein
MDPEISLPCLQQPTTGPYPKSDESNPHSHYISLRPILKSSHLGLLRGLFTTCFLIKLGMQFSSLPCVLHASPISPPSI